MFGCTRWPDCPNAGRTLEIIHGIGVPVMRCLLTGRHPDECAASADTRPEGEDVEQASSLMGGGGAESNRQADAA
jgi:hypothetical protein